jgi:hypothetical protein
MDAISGTRRTAKQLVDGTWAVTVHIDPSCSSDFLRLFPNVDMPVALAPLTLDFEQKQEKGGPLAKLAGQWCSDAGFWKFLATKHNWQCGSSDDAADCIRERCGIGSRAELDNNEEAAALFHEHFRLPFMEWQRWRKA